MVTGIVIQQAAEAGVAGFKAAKGASKVLTGYDFVGLLSRVVVFYVVALVIAKIMETIVFFSGGLNTAASLFGIPMPSTVPNSIRKLFVEGYNVGGMTIKWWDLIKVVSVVIVLMEMFQYMNQQKIIGAKPAPSTLAVFALIISALALISVPQLAQMLKERSVVNGT